MVVICIYNQLQRSRYSTPSCNWDTDRVIFDGSLLTNLTTRTGQHTLSYEPKFKISCTPIHISTPLFIFPPPKASAPGTYNNKKTQLMKAPKTPPSLPPKTRLKSTPYSSRSVKTGNVVTLVMTSVGKAVSVARVGVGHGGGLNVGHGLQSGKHLIITPARQFQFHL